MSLDEGDPTTSAKKLAWLFRTHINESSEPIPQPWLIAMNEQLELGLPLTDQTIPKGDIADQLRLGLFQAVDEGRVDFYRLHGFFEDALSIPENRRTAFVDRQQEIQRILDRTVLGTLTGVAMEFGIEVFGSPEAKPVLKQLVTKARISGLQKAGVFNEDGTIVPGQEKFVPADL